jgi:hypothetical protein
MAVMRTSLFCAFAVTAAVVVAAVEGVASTGAVCASGFEIRGECVPVGVSAYHSTAHATSRAGSAETLCRSSKVARVMDSQQARVVWACAFVIYASSANKCAQLSHWITSDRQLSAQTH